MSNETSTNEQNINAQFHWSGILWFYTSFVIEFEWYRTEVQWIKNEVLLLCDEIPLKSNSTIVELSADVHDSEWTIFRTFSFFLTSAGLIFQQLTVVHCQSIECVEHRETTIAFQRMKINLSLLCYIAVSTRLADRRKERMNSLLFILQLIFHFNDLFFQIIANNWVLSALEDKRSHCVSLRSNVITWNRFDWSVITLQVNTFIWKSTEIREVEGFED